MYRDRITVGSVSVCAAAAVRGLVATYAAPMQSAATLARSAREKTFIPVAFGYYYRPRVPATRERFQNRGTGVWSIFNNGSTQVKNAIALRSQP